MLLLLIGWGRMGDGESHRQEKGYSGTPGRDGSEGRWRHAWREAFNSCYGHRCKRQVRGCIALMLPAFPSITMVFAGKQVLNELTWSSKVGHTCMLLGSLRRSVKGSLRRLSKEATEDERILFNSPLNCFFNSWIQICELAIESES